MWEWLRADLVVFNGDHNEVESEDDNDDNNKEMNAGVTVDADDWGSEYDDMISVATGGTVWECGRDWTKLVVVCELKSKPEVEDWFLMCTTAVEGIIKDGSALLIGPSADEWAGLSTVEPKWRVICGFSTVLDSDISLMSLCRLVESERITGAGFSSTMSKPDGFREEVDRVAWSGDEADDPDAS